MALQVRTGDCTGRFTANKTMLDSSLAMRAVAQPLGVDFDASLRSLNHDDRGARVFGVTPWCILSYCSQKKYSDCNSSAYA